MSTYIDPEKRPDEARTQDEPERGSGFVILWMGAGFVLLIVLVAVLCSQAAR